MPVELCIFTFYFNDTDKYQNFMDAPKQFTYLRPQASLYFLQ